MISNDAELLLKIRQKDRQSFEHLYKLYYKKLYLLSYQYVQHQEKAEEIVHDVFMKIWNAGAELTIRQSLGAYLSRSVINTALNMIKKDKRSENHITRFQHSLDETDEPVDDAQLLEDRLLLLEQAIETLPPQCKKVLMMSKFENLKQQEIADTLNISIKTVKNHMTTGYEKIRAIMTKQQTLLINLLFFQLIGIGLICRYIVTMIYRNIF